MNSPKDYLTDRVDKILKVYGGHVHLGNISQSKQVALEQLLSLLTSEVEKGKLNALEKLQNRYKDVQSVLEEGEIPHYMGILELEIEKQRKVLSDIGGKGK